jgi:hypothetical protein
MMLTKPQIILRYFLVILAVGIVVIRLLNTQFPTTTKTSIDKISNNQYYRINKYQQQLQQQTTSTNISSSHNVPSSSYNDIPIISATSAYHLNPNKKYPPENKIYQTISLSEITRSKVLLKYACYNTENQHIILFADSENVVSWRFLPTSTFSLMWTNYQVKPAKEWYEYAKKLGYLTGKDVLFYSNGLPTPNKASNPAHCLGDTIFSLFIEGPEVMKPFDLYVSRNNPGKPCDGVKDWCCFMMEREGIFQVENFVKFSDGMCFERLWVPRYAVGRFVVDFAHLPPFTYKTKDYWYWEDPRGNWRLKGYLDQSPGTYPLSSVKEMNRRAIKGYYLPDASIQDDVRIVDSWRKVRTYTRRRNILIIPRTGEDRRLWDNPDDFVKVLVSKFSQVSDGTLLGSVMLMGVEWNTLPPLEQAKLFNFADIIISPHGAALANMMFARSNHTVMVELGCEIRSTLEDETFVVRHFSWFGSMSHRLGMLVLFFATPTAGCWNMLPKFNINGTELFDYLVKNKVFDRIG